MLITLAVGALVAAGGWWYFHCRCVNLSAFTPASLRDYIRSFGGFAVLAYICAYALNTISVVPPIAALSLTAGLAFGQVWGAVYLLTAAMLGTSATFAISRFFGKRFIDRILKGKFREFDEKLERNGFLTILFFRVVPLVPYEVLNYASGLSKIRFRDYFFATFIGLIPGVTIAAFFGGSLGEIRGVKDIFAPKLLIAVALMAALIAIPAIYTLIRKRRRA